MSKQRVYFAMYGYVYSMSIKDSIDFCRYKSTNIPCDITDFNSCKLLKIKEVDEDRDYITVGKKTIEITHCLDFKPCDFELLKYELIKQYLKL